MNSKIKIGWSEIDITPKEKIGLEGQFFDRITDKVESPISVTAFAVESGKEQMIICSCDLVSISENLHDLVKEKLKGRLPIPTDKIIISAIHTHTSYVYTRKGLQFCRKSVDVLKEMMPKNMVYSTLLNAKEGMHPDKALEYLAEKISDAIFLAWENRKEGYYANAFGRAAVGMCRRVCYDDGSAKMWGDTNLANFTELEGGNDSGIELIYTFDKNKKLNGVIANIACPAQVVEHRSFISSDYWGKVKEYLREKYGDDLKVLGLCSAAGDQAPRDLIRWVNPESYIDDPNIERNDYIERIADPSMFDISGLKLVGKRIANEISFVYEEMPLELKNEALLIHETLKLEMPLRRVTIKEYNESINTINDFFDKNNGKDINFADNARLHIYAGSIARYEIQQKINTYFDEIHIIRFGDIAIATNPYELFLDYGNQIRARSRAKQTFLIQLACGANGYLPTKKAENGSHYSAYVSSGITGHEGGNLLVRTTLEHINKMF